MSDIRQFVTSDFKESVAKMPGIPNELRRAIKDHPRVGVFIDNLVMEISHVPIGVNFTRQHIKEIVNDFTFLFIRLVKTEAEEKLMSDLKKSQLKADEEKVKSMDAALDGRVEEYFDDKDSVIITDSGVSNGSEKTKRRT